MRSIATIVALSIVAQLCSAESSSIAPPVVVDSALARPEKARKKVKPPKSLNPIKIGDPAVARKLMEKARRALNNNYNGNQYGGYNNYNANNGNQYGYNGYVDGNYYAAQKYNQAQYNNNNANAGQQNYQNYYNQGNNNNNGNSNNNWNQAGFEEWYLTQSQWLKDFSVKFQGCHQTATWNKEAQDAEDMRVQLKRLVRFKMCPTAYCNAASEEGCNNDYGEYVIDLDTFLEGYVEAKEEYDENMQQYEQYNQGQYQNAQYQNQYNNGYQNGYNNYQQNQNNEGIDIADYLECQQLDINYQEENNGYYGNQGEDEDWDGSYYIGPTCGEQGGEINLGVFKDDQCTVSAGSNNGGDLYYAATGYTLPFSQTNMLELDCIPCSEIDISDDDGGDGNQDNDSEVSEWCESLYIISGKCEENLPYGTTVNPNNQACNYVEGVKVLRQDGTILTTNRNAPRSVSSGNKAAAAFIGIFTAATALLTAYAYYLKTKLDRASIAMLE